MIHQQNKQNKIRPYKLEIKYYEPIAKLSEGACGRVLIMKNNESHGEYFVMKKLRKYDVVDRQQVKDVENENETLSIVSHPFIIRYLGFTQNDYYIKWGLEFIQGQTLMDYMDFFKKLQTQQAAYLKSENLLIAQDGYLKLIDFRFAKVVIGRTHTLCGTQEYLAPEMIMNLGYSKSVDLWTLGILIYEMITGKLPFCHQDPMQTYQNILLNKVRFPINFDSAAKSLVSKLLEKDESKRIGNLENGIDDIKNHRFFSQIDYTYLLHKKIPVPYKPTVKIPNNIKNYCIDSESYQVQLPPHNPFFEW